MQSTARRLEILCIVPTNKFVRGDKAQCFKAPSFLATAANSTSTSDDGCFRPVPTPLLRHLALAATVADDQTPLPEGGIGPNGVPFSIGAAGGDVYHPNDAIFVNGAISASIFEVVSDFLLGAYL